MPPRSTRTGLTRWTRLAGRIRDASWAERGLLIEAMGCLALSRAVVVLFPFSWVSTCLGQRRGETAHDGAPEAVAEDIGMAVRRVGGRTPWKSRCLEQALAAHVMLRRRQIASTLYVGLECGGDLAALHAWLRCGSRIVTGAPAHERHTPIASYAWPAAPAIPGAASMSARSGTRSGGR